MDEALSIARDVFLTLVLASVLGFLLGFLSVAL